MRRTLIAIAIAAAVAVPSIGQAKSFRWAAQGDILTFDPHSQNAVSYTHLTLPTKA